MQVQQELPDRIPPLDACKPTKIGEYWFDQHMHNMLKKCGQPCAHIGILPLFEVIPAAAAPVSCISSSMVEYVTELDVRM